MSEQVGCTLSQDADGITETIIISGDEGSVRADYGSKVISSAASADTAGRRLISKTLETGPGPTAKATYTYREDVGRDASGQAAVSSDRVSWTLTTSQITYPIEKYCGPSQGMSAQAWQLRGWRNEPDINLYNNFRFRDPTGAVITLTDPTQKIASKIMSGVETVMRFYPTLRKTTIYGSGDIAGLGTKLSYIDKPGSPYDGCASEWLKIGDDVTRDRTGRQTRTETWMGADSIDDDLYGADGTRWEFGSI